MKNIQCQFAELSRDVLRCQQQATRKYGDYWFCEEHGRRTPTKKKCIVVVGSTGRLGSMLVKKLRARYKVIELDKAKLDLSCEESIITALDCLTYDHIIITAALTNVDYCEDHRNEAFIINSMGVNTIARISSKKNAHVTYISTDMVFNGEKACSYIEVDRSKPINIYGESKLLGEVAVMLHSVANLVIRTSWIFGPSRPAFPEWIIKRAQNEEQISLPSDKICTPTYSLDLVDYIELLVCNYKASGTYHLCNSGLCTWQEWGQVCLDTARMHGISLKCCNIDSVQLKHVKEFKAERPLNSALNVDKFIHLTNITPRPWREATREYIAKIAANLK